MLAWLKSEAAEGRGTTGAILISCQGCKKAWRGSGAFMILVKSYQADMTECRRELYALAAEVRQSLEDLSFLEQLTRDSSVRDSFVEQAKRVSTQAEKVSGNTKRLDNLEGRFGELLDELADWASEEEEGHHGS